MKAGSEKLELEMESGYVDIRKRTNTCKDEGNEITHPGSLGTCYIGREQPPAWPYNMEVVTTICISQSI
jgi:hypothetical protein